MDHREFVAGLTPEQRRELTAKSDRAGLLHLAGHLGVIAALGVLIVVRVPFWWVLMLPLGVAQVMLFTLNHEAIHRTVFASRWLNDWIARFCGVLLVLPPEWFRFFHFEHHRHTQDPERDPELAGKAPETLWAYIRHVSGIPLWIASFKVVFGNALGRNQDGFVPASGRSKVQREAQILLLIYTLLLLGSVALQSLALLWLWVVPVILGQPFLRLYLMAEHGRCAFVANMFENSRTTFTGPIIRFFAWNMPFHAEHHAFPTVPFHKLPALHSMTAQHLRVTSEGYRAFTAETVSELH
jgi:fatty acid desaturase